MHLLENAYREDLKNHLNWRISQNTTFLTKWYMQNNERIRINQKTLTSSLQLFSKYFLNRTAFEDVTIMLENILIEKNS